MKEPDDDERSHIQKRRCQKIAASLDAGLGHAFDVIVDYKAINSRRDAKREEKALEEDLQIGCRPLLGVGR